MGRTLSATDPNAGVSSISSASGFNAGDYVYQTNSGYGPVPGNAMPSGYFNFINNPTPVLNKTATGMGNLTYAEDLGGSSGSQNAAVLVNGNIVHAYILPNSSSGAAYDVYFRIVDSSGATVVAETSTGMTAGVPYNASVVALPNGKFAIATSGYQSTSNYYPRYRIFNSDGTTSTAVFTYTAAGTWSASTQSCVMKLQAMADSSFIMSVTTSSVVAFFKCASTGFDTTFNGGSAYYSTGYGMVQYLQAWDYIVSSDGNIQIATRVDTSQIRCFTLNSSGVVQGSVSVTGLSAVFSVAIVQVSGGAIKFIMQGARSSGTDYGIFLYDVVPLTSFAYVNKIVTASAVMGGGLWAYPEGASGNFSLIYNLLSATSNTLQHNVFNSSGVAQLTLANLIPQMASAGYRMLFTPVAVGSSTRVYCCPMSNSVGNFNDAAFYSYASAPTGIAYFQYSNTTYLITNQATANWSWNSIGPFSTSGYARSASTAVAAAFYAEPTGYYSSTIAAGTELITKTLVDSSVQSRRPVAISLPNGEFAIVYSGVNAPNGTYLKKYSISGALIGSVTVSAAGSTSAPFACCGASFANGSIAVVYQDGSGGTNLKYAVYDSNLSLVTSGTLATGTATPTLPLAPAICGFGDGTYVAVAYKASGGSVAYRTISNLGVVSSVIDTIGTDCVGFSVIGYKAKAFAVAGATTSNYFASAMVRQIGASTFASYGYLESASISATSSGTFTDNNNTPSSGSLGLANVAIAGRVNPVIMGPWCLGAQGYTPSIASTEFNTSYQRAMGYTGDGDPVMAAPYRGTAPNARLNIAALSPDGAVGQFSNRASITNSYSTLLSTDASLSIAPHVGGAAIVAYIDDFGLPAFVSVVVNPFTVGRTLTAGVDVSATTLSLSPQTGYALQGVSITAASAGGAGLVQTRGSAQLSSSYSASTPVTNFDFRNPTTTGVRGSVSGRSVNLES